MLTFIFAAMIIWTPSYNVATTQDDSNLVKEDEEAVKTVIEKQIDAYRNRNLEGEMELWMQNEKILKVTAQGQVIEGWESLRNRYATLFADPDFSEIGEWTTTTDNINIVIDGNFAWIVHNQQDVTKLGWRRKTLLTMQTRILKKVNGQWKILFHQTVDLPRKRK